MRKQLDLRQMPTGVRYEDTYGAWLSVFKMLAESRDKYDVTSCPRSWASLVYYLGNEVLSVRDYFATDPIARCTPELLQHFEAAGLLRSVIENHATLRPELVDALYKVDMEWGSVLRLQRVSEGYTPDPMILVTSNSSFFRPEFLHYLDKVLPRFHQTKKKCVIVPCAADKPYPAPLHLAVRSNIPDDYEIIIATGVLGLVPESLWPKMPLYDSGMPNQWRCMLTVEKFFQMYHFTNIVVYSDFYASAVCRGLHRVPASVGYVFGVEENMPYQDLLSEKNLAELKRMAV